MSEDPISVIEVAKYHGKHKQTIFKVLRRLGIETGPAHLNFRFSPPNGSASRPLRGGLIASKLCEHL